MDTLKSILGDDAEDKIKNVMGSLTSSDGVPSPTEGNDGLNQLMQLKSIVENMAVNKNDPRTNLLLSLKPYMRDGRKNSIDSAVKLLGITRLTGMFRK